MGKTAIMGMTILNEYTNNGIGNKLTQIREKWAHENDVHKLQLEIRHTNIPSIVNCIKNRFIITGIKYDDAYINNKWVHMYILEKVIKNG